MGPDKKLSDLFVSADVEFRLDDGSVKHTEITDLTPKEARLQREAVPSLFEPLEVSIPIPEYSRVAAFFRQLHCLARHIIDEVGEERLLAAR